jgi:predicted PurR-regulated permease PerM
VTATDLATVLVTMAGIAAFVVLLVVAIAMVRSLRELRATLEHVQRETLPALAALHQTAVEAGLEVERIDDLLETAESISATVEGASRLGYLAFRRPMISVVAAGRGVGRGMWRLVGGGRSRGERPAA